MGFPQLQIAMRVTFTCLAQTTSSTLGGREYLDFMLSISTSRKVASSVVEYYGKGIEAALERYYRDGRHNEGEFYGSALPKLGLSPKADPVVLKNLLDGYSADRQRALVQNAGKMGRQCCWDLTLNAPKCVSVLWAFSPPDVQKIIEEVFQEATKTTLDYAEKACGYTRRGKGGRIVQSVSLLFFATQHTVSRAQQPHLHSHNLLINVGVRRDGTTGSLVAKQFFEQKTGLGTLFRTELAAGLRRRLGLTIVPEEVGFQIHGLSKDICKAFSERRRQIEQRMNELGQQGAVAAKTAALDTRPKKQELSPDELSERWQQIGKQFGWGQEQALQLIHIRGPEKEPTRKIPEELSNQPSLLTTGKRKLKQIRELVTHIATTGVTSTPKSEKEPKTRPPKIKQPKFHVEWRRLGDKTPWIPAKERFLTTEWRSIFPDAALTPLRKLQLPVVVVALPRLVFGPRKQYKPRWWSITYKRDLAVGELRMQQRMLFPNAPKWSPFHRLSDTVIRFTPRKSKWQPIQQDYELNRDIPL